MKSHVALHVKASAQKVNSVRHCLNLDIEQTSNFLTAVSSFKRSFKYSGAMLWNNLSYEAKTAQSLSDFKHKLASSPSTCFLLNRTDSMLYTFYFKYIYTLL